MAPATMSTTSPASASATSTSPDIDPDPNVLEEMRRMAYDRSKWLQTYTFIITQYEFNKEEMTQFYSEMCDVLERMKTYLKCPYCKHTIKKVCYARRTRAVPKLPDIRVIVSDVVFDVDFKSAICFLIGQEMTPQSAF